MSNTTQTTKSGGIGFLGLLTIVFITLKLTHYIDWHWKWVLAPLWIPFALVLFLCALWLIATIGLALVKRHDQKKRAKLAKPKFVSEIDRRL